MSRFLLFQLASQFYLTFQSIDPSNYEFLKRDPHSYPQVSFFLG